MRDSAWDLQRGQPGTWKDQRHGAYTLGAIKREGRNHQESTCLPIYGIHPLQWDAFLALAAHYHWRITRAGYDRGCMVVHCLLIHRPEVAAIVTDAFPLAYQVIPAAREFQDIDPKPLDKDEPGTLY